MAKNLSENCVLRGAISRYGDEQGAICSQIFGHDDPKQVFKLYFCGEILDSFLEREKFNNSTPDLFKSTLFLSRWRRCE